MNSASILYFF